MIWFLNFQRLIYPNTKAYSFLLLTLLSNTANAVDTATLNVGAFVDKGFKLEGVSISFIDLHQKRPQFRLSATKLTLPKPFSDLSLADIQCTDFTWDHDELHCNQGRASVRSAYWQSPSTNFSFHLSQNHNRFKLENIRLAGSHLSLDAVMNGENWQCKVKAEHISNKLVDKLLQSKPPKQQQARVKQGSLNLAGTFSGKLDTVQEFNFTAEVEGLADQAEDGKVATEKLNLLTHWEGEKSKEDWVWQSESKITGGAVYVDPVYLEAGVQSIVLNTQGFWHTKTKKADILAFTYQHPEVGVLSGKATAYYRDGIKIDKADVVLHSETLQGLLTTYINPFFTESPFTGVTVTGDVQANFTFHQQALTDTSIHFSKLNVKDDAGHLAINDGSGLLNWSDNPMLIKRSELAWQQFSIKGLPMGPTKIPFINQGNSFTLVDKIKIPFLGGFVAVDKFSWQAKKQEEPDVSFAGSLDNVSLEQLSKRLGWTTLSGNISGYIPKVDYRNKRLSLDGELLIKAFDGTVKVNNLAASGLFTDLPKIYGDVAIDNLDLNQLTQKFEFGNITGRLSGFINKFMFENWQPVSFYAWFGTPDTDDSSHTISQKAVKNIASIGGGGASDAISRSFLGMFETFRYDKIGVGCYLHDGVCQMMGLEAKGQGYYLIKGGWLPRIDVLGYNSQINWDVLVERLRRVASPEKVIIQ